MEDTLLIDFRSFHFLQYLCFPVFFPRSTAFTAPYKFSKGYFHVAVKNIKKYTECASLTCAF
jgi:hypothetical protein